MTGCEGQMCLRRSECQRYLLRDQCELVSRVMCRLPQTPWFVKAVLA